MNNKFLNKEELGGFYRDRAIKRFSERNPNFFKKSNEEIFDIYYNKFLVTKNYHFFTEADVLSFLQKQSRYIYENNTVKMPKKNKMNIVKERKSPLELELKFFFDTENLCIPERIPLEIVNTDINMNNYLRKWAEKHDISANLYSIVGSNDKKTTVAVYRIEQDFSNGTSHWNPVNLSEKNVYLIGSNSNVNNNILEIKEKVFGNQGVTIYIVKNFHELPKTIPKKTNFEEKYSVNLEKVVNLQP